MPLSDIKSLEINRRRLLALTATGATAPLAMPQAKAVQPEPRLVAERLSVAAIQSRAAPWAVSENLAGMLAAIDRVHDGVGPKHLITFSAQALQGLVPGDAADLAAVAIDVDGRELSAVAEKARAVQAHIAFGAWVRDADWPGRVIAMSILIGPDGGLIAKDWKPLQDASAMVGAGQFATTIDAELDRFVELYGRNAVLPVHATSIGRIALSPLVAGPEVYRAYALKGAEVFLRTAPQGAPDWDLQATAAYNQAFTVMTTTACDVEAAVPGRGGTTIVGPRGEILAEAGSKWEQAVTATLPIADLRATRRPIEIPTALVLPVYERAMRDFA